MVEHLKVFDHAGFFSIEPASGAVVQAFTTGTVVHVFLLAGSAPTEAWSGSAPGNES